MTLVFSIDRYEQVIEAYLAGLERRVEEGKPIGLQTVIADASGTVTVGAYTPLPS